MLDIIRTRAQSFAIKLIFGVIIVVFIFWGVGNIGKDSTGSLATVNGETITAQEFGKVFSRAVEAQRQKDPELTTDAERFKRFKQQVLGEIVLMRLREQEAVRLGLSVTPYELMKVIGALPVFQDASGKFDKDLYIKLLAAQKMTPGEFEAEYSRQLLDEKLQRYIAMSVGVSEFEAKNLYSFSLEKRKAEYVLFSAADYKDKAAVSAEEVAAYYAANKEKFRTPVRANVEFVRLTPDALAAGYPVSDQELKDFYEKNKESFKEPARYESRHIFVACPPDGSAEPGAEEKIAKARATIMEADKKLKSGAEFGALAATYSEDQQSAKEGGMLGWMDKGQIGAKEFEDAALAMKPGTVSEPIRTAYGFHIIKLEDKKDASTKQLEEVKAAITAELGKEKADADFQKVQKAAEDALTMGTPLADIASKFKVKVASTGLLPLTEVEASLAPHKDSRQMLENSVASLAAASASPSTNSTAKAPAPVVIPVPLNVVDGIALVRVVEAQPSVIPSLESMKESIVSTLKDGKALELARSAAKEALPAFNGTVVPDAWKGKVQTSKAVARVFPEVAPLGNLPALAEAMFSAPKGVWLSKVYDTANGAVIARTSDIEPVSDAEWTSLKGIFMAQLQQSKQQDAVEAFMQNVIANAKVEQSTEMLDKMTLR